MELGKVIIKAVLDKKEFDKDIENLDSDSGLKSTLTKIADKFSSLFSKAGKQTSKIGKSFKAVGSIMIKTIGTVIKSIVGIGVAFATALAVITLITLAIIAIVEAVKQVFEKNSKLKTDLQYIIFAIKTALQPVIDWIVNALAKIIQFVITIFKYAMAIANLIAGRNLFEKATPEAFAKSMEDANKSSKGVAKNAKDIKKQLAGFDEMNVLQDNKAGGGGAGNVSQDLTPSFDLSKFTDADAKVQGFVDKVKKAYNDILTADRNTTAQMLLNSDKTWGTLKLGWFDFEQGNIKMLEGLKQHWSGIWDMIVGIFTGNLDKIEAGAKKWWDGAVLFFKGLWQQIVGIGEMIWGSVKGIGIKIWEFIRDKVIKPITDKIDSVKNRIKDNFKDGFWKGIGNTFVDVMNKIIDKINNKLSFTIGDKTAAFLRGIGIKDAKAGKYQIVSIPKLPRLAKGAIANAPGRGIPTTSGTGRWAEAGPEAYLPLTDQQVLSSLGKTIGENVHIVATVPVYVGNRQIAREIKNIQAEESFGYNG